MSKFSVGQRVFKMVNRNRVEGTVREIETIRGDVLLHIERDDGVQGSGTRGWWTSPESGGYWKPVVAEAKSDSWDYAEAERLYLAAVEAMAEYNRYIERKPVTNYLPGSAPAKW